MGCRVSRGTPSDLSPEEVDMVLAALNRALVRRVRGRHFELADCCSGCGSPRHVMHGACPVCLLLLADGEVPPAPVANRPARPAHQDAMGRAAGHPREEAA